MEHEEQLSKNAFGHSQFSNSHAMKTDRRSPADLVGGWCSSLVLTVSRSCFDGLMVSRSCCDGVPVLLSCFVQKHCKQPQNESRREFSKRDQ